MQEVWKPIAGYETFYEVSNLGRVRSLDRSCRHADGKVTNRKGKTLKPALRAGYPFVLIQVDGVRWQIHVHRLVATAFCEKPEGCDVVNHLDGDKQNNSSANLEWTTTKGNNQHAWKAGLNVAQRGEQRPNSVLTEDQVESIRRDIVAGETGTALAKKYGVHVMTISGIRNGARWAHVGGELVEACKESDRKISHKGESHPNSKLNDQVVSEVIRRLCRRDAQKDIARDLGIGQVIVSNINMGISWKHVRVEGCGEPPYFLKYARRKPKTPSDQARQQHL